VTYEQRSVYLPLTTYLQAARRKAPSPSPRSATHLCLRRGAERAAGGRGGEPHRAISQAGAAHPKRMRAIRMKFYLREPLWSSTLSAFNLPEGVFYDHLHDLLRERGYVVYAGQAQLAESNFRVANMGALTEANITGFWTPSKRPCRSAEARRKSG